MNCDVSRIVRMGDDDEPAALTIFFESYNPRPHLLRLRTCIDELLAANDRRLEALNATK